jgi:aspartyl-tRNA synthetase
MPAAGSLRHRTTGMDSIREVIAFPKTGGGVDPLTDAPAPLTAQHLKESGIDAQPKQVDQA